jgi:hypothetical protein
MASPADFLRATGGRSFQYIQGSRLLTLSVIFGAATLEGWRSKPFRLTVMAVVVILNNRASPT